MARVVDASSSYNQVSKVGKGRKSLINEDFGRYDYYLLL